MKTNLVEMIVVLVIFLFVFTTLVLFYENKIDSLEEELNTCNNVVTISE